MATPTYDTGSGETVTELEKGLGFSAEDPIHFDEKNGGGVDEEVQVAKKARVEKGADNVDDAAAEVEGDGVESVKDMEEPELEAHNGNESVERINGEGEEEDVAAAEGDVEDEESVGDDAAPAASAGTTAKDASTGDVGLRTLLQDGEAPKATGLVNGTEDATHMLNGAK